MAIRNSKENRRFFFQKEKDIAPNPLDMLYLPKEQKSYWRMSGVAEVVLAAFKMVHDMERQQLRSLLKS